MTRIKDRVRHYKAYFSDGTIENVPGCYAAHAWAVARELWPNKEISGLQLLESPENPIPEP